MSLKRQGAEKFRDTHLKQKYNLMHALPSMEAPELSGLYFKSFFYAVKRYQLNLPSYLLQPNSKFCGSCGSVRVPMYNTKMVVQEEKCSEPIECKRNLVYTCLNCQEEAKFPLKYPVNENSSKKRESSSEYVATWPQAKEINGKVDKKSSAKERAKKRKTSTLSHLLLKKNGDQKKKSLSSLNLESFMERN